MNYTSTRNPKISTTLPEVIVKGISSEGGLFVPEKFPKFSLDDIQSLADMSYQERAFFVLEPFLGFSEITINKVVNNAYGKNFSSMNVSRLVNMDASTYMLELWHGPTAAFKDMALQILPELLVVSKNYVRNDKKTLILVATSGDTGKAALEGFKDKEGIEIAVFFPEDGVSDTQKLQMTTQKGRNVHVFGVKGNFDDCQNTVKEIFVDKEVSKKAAKTGMELSSANSINWGRLCPQIVYYFAAYADLISKGSIKCGDKVNICVPTGNFGNILAAYYALEMGLPVGKLICASNSNNVLTDFINTGIYDKNRGFNTTISPSMDILVSSNLERLLYHLTDGNHTLIKKWFTSLSDSGRFEVDESTKSKMSELFYGSWSSEDETLKTINSIYNEQGYLMDTHTAVAYKVLGDYNELQGMSVKMRPKTIVVSTASPYKFSGAVYNALYGQPNIDDLKDEVESRLLALRKSESFEQNEDDHFGADDFDGDISTLSNDAIIAKALEQRTGIKIPKPLSDINGIPRFTRVLEKAEIKLAVLDLLS